MKKIMHLNAFMIHSPMNHTVGSWIHPDSTVGSSIYPTRYVAGHCQNAGAGQV